MSPRSSSKFSFLIGALLLVFLVFPTSFASTDKDLEVVGQRTSATAVAVTLANSGDVAREGLVVVTVRVADGYERASVRVKIQPNATEVAVVSFGSPVDGVIVVEISEDSSPM